MHLGREDFKEVVDSALTKLDVPAEALFSTLGRTAARGFRNSISSSVNLEFYDKLIENIKGGDRKNGKYGEMGSFYMASRSQRCR